MTTEGSTSILIVGGCGHIGLPLGMAFAEAGARTTLLDTWEARVKQVEAGCMPFFERGAEGLLPKVLASGRLKATTDVAAVRDHEVIVITIGTPVDEFLDPSIGIFDRAVETILDQMHDGQLLILRSTVFPGVTDRLAHQVAERGLDIDIAYCPERIAQGYALEELGGLPQIIGGMTEKAAERAVKVFQLLGVRTINVMPAEAELCKLFANAYRYINFAIANQFYAIAERFGADFGRIHEAMTTDYPRLKGFPKAGFAGGPCLLKDTMQLAAFNHNDFILGQAAMMVNEGLPSILVKAAKKDVDLRDKKVAILGMAFKGNNDDPRDSLSYKLRKVLLLECKEVLCTDPYIEDPRFIPLETALQDADVFFVGACHDEYRDLVIEKPVYDVFNFLPGNGKSSVQAH